MLEMEPKTSHRLDVLPPLSDSSKQPLCWASPLGGVKEDSWLLSHLDMEFARIINCRNTPVIRPQPDPDLCGDTVYVSPPSP